MKVLYIGDIMGKLGIEAVGKSLPEVKNEHKPDLIIAQAENVTDGKSMSPSDMDRLQRLGIHFFTGGNHTPKREDLHPLLRDDAAPVIGPANMPTCPGKGWKYLSTPKGEVLIASILGQTVGSSASILVRNPLYVIDSILHQSQNKKLVAIIVNFHGDYSSEKVVFGHYLDGRVSGVIGDHWHVPTADARVLPKGTAHMSDVGMCGALNSSLGVRLDTIIPRWKDGVVNKNILDTAGPLQFSAALIDVDEDTGLSRGITHIYRLPSKICRPSGSRT
jgi:2',3'-cyclic-nucleotide 2'-phosphodiesterase